MAGEMGGEGDKGLERGLWERAERGHSLAGSREAGLALHEEQETVADRS